MTGGWSGTRCCGTLACARAGPRRSALKTEYISFEPPEVAAVKLLNHPAFFETFAATLRHRDTANGSSSVTYIYHFTARPRWLRWLLHPVMNAVFRWETRKRLRSLRRYLALRQLQRD